MTSDGGTLILSKEYVYDGENTNEIPYDTIEDLGGAILVECPDESVRMFDKDEVEL